MADLMIDVHHHFHTVPDDTVAKKLDQILAALTNLNLTGEKTLAQIDDLKAALDDVSGKVDAVGAEVTDLIAKLSSLPPSPDLTAAIAQAQSIAAKLAAIPPEPTA